MARETIEQRVAHLETQVTELSKLPERMSALEQRMSGLEERMGGLDQRMGGLDQRMDALDKTVSDLSVEMGTRFDETRAEMRALFENAIERIARIQEGKPSRSSDRKKQ